MNCPLCHSSLILKKNAQGFEYNYNEKGIISLDVTL